MWDHSSEPGRFALGKISLIAGLPDMGKGQIAAFLAAAVTAALDLPCDEGTAPQGIMPKTTHGTLSCRTWLPPEPIPSAFIS
jgi:hypothetical protein